MRPTKGAYFYWKHPNGGDPILMEFRGWTPDDKVAAYPASPLVAVDKPLEIPANQCEGIDGSKLHK